MAFRSWKFTDQKKKKKVHSGRTTSVIVGMQEVEIFFFFFFLKRARLHQLTREHPRAFTQTHTEQDTKNSSDELTQPSVRTMESRQDWRAALHESELASPVLGCRCYTVKWETVENLLWSLAVSSTLQFTRTSVRWSFASFRLLPNFSKKKKKKERGGCRNYGRIQVLPY